MHMHQMTTAARAALSLAMILAVPLIVSQKAPAQTETVLYSFGSQLGDGNLPYAGLVMDKQGNFYGTTETGGVGGVGTVFELSSAGVETVLYSFSGSDGNEPLWGSLIIDRSGNLYGTTFYGGANNEGVVYKLVHPRTNGGMWKEKVLYSFGSYSGDALYPEAGLTMDTSGNLYGTTDYGGTGACVNGTYDGCGAVFKISSTGTESVLYSFQGGQTGDGQGPSGLIMDKQGNFYGTTTVGGPGGGGMVFSLSSAGTETILYGFCSKTNCVDGNFPIGGLTMDAKGNLYGTTYNGGAENEGVVYKLLRPAQGGAWKETVLHSFGSYSGDGVLPWAVTLVRDKEGNFYGTTGSGGVGCSPPGCGTVFKVTSTGAETVLYSFGTPSGDGTYPNAGLVIDASGNLYGTTLAGGVNNGGTVFMVVP